MDTDGRERQRKQVTIQDNEPEDTFLSEDESLEELMIEGTPMEVRDDSLKVPKTEPSSVKNSSNMTRKLSNQGSFRQT